MAVIPAYLESSTILIKSLKAAQDPPQVGFPSKIVIAQDAWKADSVYVPRKAEVLREWIIESWSRVGKGKGKDVGLHPVLVSGYHQLLLDVSQTSKGASTSSMTVSPPLSILQSFFALATISAPADLSHLVGVAQQAFALIYPANHTSDKAEAWADAWTAMVSFIASVEPSSISDDAKLALERLAELVSKSTVTALAGSQNRRKIAQAAFPTLPALATSLRTHTYLASALQLAFTPLFLPLAVLQSHSPTPIGLLLPSISSSPLLLSVILSSYISAVQASRYTLFPPPTSSKLPPDVYVASMVRTATQTALYDILKHIESQSCFEARFGIWSVIQKWGGYLENESGWTTLLASEGRRVERTLRDGAGDDAEWVLKTCAVLVSLDHAAADVNEDILVYCWMAPVSLGGSSKAVFSSLITFHTLTHTVPALFTLLTASIESLFTPIADASQVYQSVATGILSSPWLANEILSALRSGFVGGKRGRVWAEVTQSLDAALKLAATKAETNKRTKLDEAKVEVSSSETVGLLSRLMRIVVAAAVGVEDANEEAVGAVSQLNGWSSFPWQELVPAVEGKNHKRKAPSLCINDIELAARVRLSRMVSRLVYAAGDDFNDDLAHVVSALESASSRGAGEASFELTQWAIQILSTQQFREGDQAVASLAVDAILLQTKQTSAAWSGRVAAVTNETAAVATWSLLADRGLVLLDLVATTEQLGVLANALVVAFDEATSIGITPGSVIVRILTTAEFWELSRLRVALLEKIRTAAAADDATALKAFAIAGYCPTSYLSKNLRGALVGTAYALDRKAVNAGLRRFLLRLAVDFGVLGPLATDFETIKHFIAASSGSTRGVTQELLSKAFDAVAGDSVITGKLLESCKAIKPFSAMSKKAKKGKPVSVEDLDDASRHALLFLERLSNKPIDKLSEHGESAKEVISLVIKYLQPCMTAQELPLAVKVDLLGAWETTLRVAKWSHSLDQCNLSQSAQLVSAVLRGPRGDAVVLASATLRVIVSETSVTGKSSELVLASYVAITQHASVDAALDAALLACSPSVESYEVQLRDVVEAITAGATDSLLLALLQAAKVLLRVHVEGTGRLVTHFISSLLLALQTVIGTAEVTLSLMELVETVVTERIVQIRLSEVTVVCDLLLVSLLPSSAPRVIVTRPEVLHHALNTIYTLARHRPDLVLATLPLITVVLSSVINVLQAPRANLGGKVRARAVAELPVWIADGQELGDGEAKRLARILTTLASRSSWTAAVGAQEKISLAGPFSKHAPGLLVAYVRAVADTSSGLSTGIRKELEPGLFALCEVITAGGRAEGREGEGVGEAYGLGEVSGDAEREVWADLWRRWGKERYVGQG